MHKNRKRHAQSGSALLMAMIFLAVFSTLGLAMMTMSSTNAQIADNHRGMNRALESAQSGLEVVRYLFEGLSVSGSTSSSSRMTTLYSKLGQRISETGMTGITVVYDTSLNEIQIQKVDIDSATDRSFQCRLSPSASDSMVLVADVIGHARNVDRSVRISLNFATRGQGIFDFGIATKGPLLMSGQAAIAGINLAVESDVLIDTVAAGNSFEIGNQASVAGKVHIVNPYASYSIGSKSVIGGEKGTQAEKNIILGVSPVDFPTPDTEHFRQYATGPVINSSSTLNNYSVLNNAIIASNTNPTFASNMQINGVLFIEQPNKVSFAGKVDIRGIIVGSSQVGDSTADNNFNFSGQVECFDMSELQGSQFDGIKQEAGTFMVAPGFSTDFSGQANVINGVMAVAGARFTGQAGGTIHGSIINYSQDPVVLQGQSELLFNRSGTSQNPAGFAPSLVLEYSAGSYNEYAI